MTEINSLPEMTEITNLPEMTEINNLPEEVMVKIYHKLCPKDLKMIVLVCKTWREMGEDPLLWNWSHVCVHRHDIFKLNIRRLKCVQYVDVASYYWPWEDDKLKQLFQALIRLPRLKIITGLAGINLSSVEPELLSKVACLKFVEMSCTYNTLASTYPINDPARELFTLMCQNSRDMNNLSTVQPHILASTTKDHLDEARLTSEQVACILTLCQKDPKRWRLWMFSNNDNGSKYVYVGPHIPNKGRTFMRKEVERMGNVLLFDYDYQ